jgi:hypothetical protein
MQTHRWMLSLITALSLTALATAGQPEPSANVEQTDLAAAYTCHVTSPPIFTPMPIDVPLTTSGGPVLLTLTVSGSSSSGTGSVSLVFTVDGQSVTPTLTPSIGGLWLLSPSRVVDVSPGRHTFGALLACEGNAGTDVGVGPAWLSAYELPLIRK